MSTEEIEDEAPPTWAAATAITGCPVMAEGRAPTITPGQVRNPETGTFIGGWVCQDAYGRDQGQCDNMECIFYGGIGFTGDLTESWVQWEPPELEVVEIPSDEDLSSYLEDEGPRSNPPSIRELGDQVVTGLAGGLQKAAAGIGEQLGLGITQRVEDVIMQNLGLDQTRPTAPRQPSVQ